MLNLLIALGIVLVSILAGWVAVWLWKLADNFRQVLQEINFLWEFLDQKPLLKALENRIRNQRYRINQLERLNKDLFERQMIYERWYHMQREELERLGLSIPEKL